MDNRKSMPFYMTFPLPPSYEREDSESRDFEYLQQIYPLEVRKYQGYVQDYINKIDYEGSFLYDEYPDKWTLYKRAKELLNQIQADEGEFSWEKGSGKREHSEKWIWIGHLIHLLFSQEIYQRRHRNKKGIVSF